MVAHSFHSEKVNENKKAKSKIKIKLKIIKIR